MSCFKPSLCTEERERGKGGVTGKGERGRGGERERGGRDRWGGWNGKGEKGKGRGAAGKVGGWKCRVRLGYLLFRFRMFPFIFFFRFK